MNNRIILKKNKHKTAFYKHPWIFSQNINEIEDNITDGDWVNVFDFEHNFLGSGYFNSKSILTIRLFNFLNADRTELEIIRELIVNAVKLRKGLYTHEKTSAIRIINGEGDFLPGLICDLYRNVLVFQFNSLGLMNNRTMISEITVKNIADILEIDILSTIDKTPEKIISIEGIKKEAPVIFGKKITELIISENSQFFYVDLEDGQKTGFYSDQRQNRKIICDFIRNLSGYDFFSYTGGFAINLAKNNTVIAVESSENACKILNRNSELNNLNISVINDDVYKVLRGIKECDFINADPPKYIFNTKNKTSGEKQYSLLYSLCLKKIKPGGFLGASSCSGLLNYDDFLAIITREAIKNNRKLQIIYKGGGGLDYPINAHCPESEYLKFALFRVL